MSRSPRRLGATFIALGTLHFLRPRTYEAIVPDYLPAHREIVYISGVAEIAGGLGMTFAPTRRLAGWWLIATLVAIFPANVNMAIHPRRYPAFPRWALWARLPFQALFIWSAWRATRAR